MAISSVASVSGILLLSGALLASQAPSSASSPANSGSHAAADPTPQAAPENLFISDLGFTYTYPQDWEVVDSKPMMPAVQLQMQEKAAGDNEKRGAACTQVALLLRHGSPASVILAVALPYDCYGSKFAQSDLAGVGSGVSKGLQNNFELKDSKYGAYKSGKHNLWIERAMATSKAHPDQTFTIETVCGLLDKGMICWMGLVKDEANLKLFEDSIVSLEGEKPTALVPADAFTLAKP